MKFLILPLLLVHLSFPTEKNYGKATVANIVSVYDGDTFTADMSKSWPPIIGERIEIRVRGIDTPEMRDPNDSLRAIAKKAQAFTDSIVRHAKKIIVYDMIRDKYFRINAFVQIDGKYSLSELLIAKGLARPYFGVGPKPW